MDMGVVLIADVFDFHYQYFRNRTTLHVLNSVEYPLQFIRKLTCDLHMCMKLQKTMDYGQMRSPQVHTTSASP